MNNIPHRVSEYSPQKINGLLKQTKAKKQHQNQELTQEEKETNKNKTPSDQKKKTDGLLDVYA